MALLLDRRNKRAAQLRAKVDMLKEKVKQISEDLKHDEKILELFERYNWDVGLQKVMEPRIRYLAAAAMTIKPDDRDNLISIRGQYEEAKKLARSKEELISAIDENLKNLDRAGAELAEAVNQLEKIKE